MAMKNGYTPREFAHSIAVDALRRAFYNELRELDGLPPAEAKKAREAIEKMHNRLLDAAKLDAGPLMWSRPIGIDS